MARGGTRQGAPGKAYPNRADLQGAKASTGLRYGEHQQLVQAQQQMPIPQVSTPSAGGVSAGRVAMPGQLPFDRPSERPTEPVTAGIPAGAGPGPEALSTVTLTNDDIGNRLRALYQVNPNNDLLRLIELHDHGY